MKWLQRIGLIVVVLVLIAIGIGSHLWRRALPQTDGVAVADGISAPAEVLRDQWGVPHIFAKTEQDAAYALGWVMAQDRLFQLELVRHVCQGRLAELFGADVVPVDRLFRTLDFHGHGKRMLARAKPEVIAMHEAYARGINAYLKELDGRLPVEFTLLGLDPEPFRADDFAGLVGYQAWVLQSSWKAEPLYEQLVATVGTSRAAALFPYNLGGSPPVHPTAAIAPTLLQLPERSARWLELLPQYNASNNWVVGPAKSASGQAILANDPHLGHALPCLWYEAHLSAGDLDVIGVTTPGAPGIVIGHNRNIAWGFTNVMLDPIDFFVEKVNPNNPDQVMAKGAWVEVQKREEEVRVKGSPSETLVVRSTSHGPIVSGLMPGQSEVLAMQWTFHTIQDANDFEAAYALQRARDWKELRRALRSFGAIAQNVAFADREGHIGMQTAGRIPKLRGPRSGSSYRVGWDGSEDWDGFIPFDDNPRTFDPPRGWLASANNVTVPAPADYYISSYWEPADRFVRIEEMIEAKDKLSVDDMKTMQMDVVFVSAREWLPEIRRAFEVKPPGDAFVRQALEQLRAWDGAMTAEGVAPAIMATFERRLFHAIFDDEMGTSLARSYELAGNLRTTMIRVAMTGGDESWFDRTDTPEIEDRFAILRSAFEQTVEELVAYDKEISSWRWGELHTLTFRHPLGKSWLLAPLFNVGPFPLAGHNNTVNKAASGAQGWSVVWGPSMRQITDFGDLDQAIAVLPTGQSGIVASHHYADQTAMWRDGAYHPSPMTRAKIEPMIAARLTLRP